MSRKNIDGSKGTVDLKIPHMFSLVQQGPLRGYYLCRQQSFTPETSWPQIPSPKGLFGRVCAISPVSSSRLPQFEFEPVSTRANRETLG